MFFGLLYGLVNMIRNYLYDKAYIKSTKFSHPVISVGNLSAGGTGKTPHIEYLIRLLNSHYPVATLSRGYGRKTSGLHYANEQSTAASIGDEPMMYHLKFPQVPVVVSENRLIAIPDILSQHPENKVILLDDAFQHRAVKPGLSILLSDYAKPFYEDRIIPAGMLREPKSEYKRADIIVITKCPSTITLSEKATIKEKIKAYPYQHIYFSSLSYDTIYGMFARAYKPIENLSKHSILLCTGIANDQAINDYLSSKVKDIYPFKFRDHHYFDRYDIERLVRTFENIPNPEKIILTTEKDATRLSLLKELIIEKELPIYILPVKVQFDIADQIKFEEDILTYVNVSMVKYRKQHKD